MSEKVYFLKSNEKHLQNRLVDVLNNFLKTENINKSILNDYLKDFLKDNEVF